MTDDAPEGTPLATPVRRKRHASGAVLPPVDVRPVALVGLPGSGKSTVARLLAERLGWRWVDLDERIEAVTGQWIPELFERGEEHFRAAETEVLRGVLAVPTEVVVATGGGIVTSETNRATLAARSTVVWLDLPVDVAAERLAADDAPRPLLAHDDARARLAALAQARLPLYEATADHRVDASAAPPEVVEAIAASLERSGSPQRLGGDARPASGSGGGTDR